MSIDDRPEWWDDYLGYLDSQEARHEGQDARIHEDGFGAGWTLGYEAGAESERARAERAEARVRTLEAVIEQWGYWRDKGGRERCYCTGDPVCRDRHDELCDIMNAALAAPATADPNAPPKLVLRAAGIET